MQELWEALQRALQLDQVPSAARIVDSMDAVAWILVGLLAGAVILGVFFSLSTRRTFTRPDEVESTPEATLARLKEDPSYLPPLAIVSRLGAESTLELLEYGDRVDAKEWRYRWGIVREELLALLSRQNAFGPTYALARYYRSADTQEPDALRIRRTVLIHKLGILRRMEPDADGNPAVLRIRSHPAEVQGDLGFAGDVHWLMPGEPPPPAVGPVIEMEPVEFASLKAADVQINIRRSPVVGGGFQLHLEKRHKIWVVIDEEMDWVG
ncbi:MAG: hypothetical protein H6642_12735 [Caldilineaceae bacterium]|nr:hypothetical protein [Caldilineaceae bacterium]